MSIRSLTYLALQRDSAPATEDALGGGGRAAAPGGAGAGIPQQFVDVLTSAIPTEPLAAYTAIIAFIAGVIGSSGAYVPLRWFLYAGFLGLIVAALGVAYGRRTAPEPGMPAVTKRPFPWAEGAAALIAGGAWGLAMPGSALNGQLHGDTRAITTAVIAISAAAVLLTVAVPQLQKGVATPPQTALGEEEQSGAAPDVPAANDGDGPSPAEGAAEPAGDAGSATAGTS